MRHKLIALDTLKLVIERDPDARAEYPNDGLSLDWPDSVSRKPDLDQYDDSDLGVMARAIANHPEAIAQLFEEYGIGVDEILQAVYDDSGYIPF